MAKIRFRALEKALRHKPVAVYYPSDKISDYFGINVLDVHKMKKYLSKDAYEQVLLAIETGTRIDRKIADHVASAMKDWAISRGATHYTHWFHPLTEGTAEKHEAFFELAKNNEVFEVFDGKLLAQQEPDASSFPSGGIRNTFEARGYTAWDPSSPAFVIGKTLCIPTIFISYTGESLDYKTPLLKSATVLDKAAVNVCRLFDKNVKKVFATLGWEQEYFLVDEDLYNARPDLILTQRTLMGHSSAKDQQLEDHYFGSIPERVMAYMQDFEIECHKLGIPVRTRHNEVAPNQFECAPIFEEVNLAVDHNQLLMDLMARIAKKHHFVALLHEKPYNGVNGSGKHNNWSMATDTGINLLAPGKNAKSNLQFLTFLVNIVKSVNDYCDLLRASIATAGNEHRLGGNEAPPSIISVFLGTRLTQMLNFIETKLNEKVETDQKTGLKLDIGKIPEILLDNTDRNRTSPFAFTGNRFEFRAVGSSANCASAMITLNTIVANQLVEFKKEIDLLESQNIKREEAILQILQKYISVSKKILFEGNGYSQEWVEEAERRGLPNISAAPEALKAYINEKNISLFVQNKIFSERELEARYEVYVENYAKRIQIESRVLGDLAINHIIPTAVQYQNKLIKNFKGTKSILGKENSIVEHSADGIKLISELIHSIKIKTQEMIEERKQINKIESYSERAMLYSTKIRNFIEEIRNYIDNLEMIVDDEMWPLPKYRELLFVR